MQCEEKIYAHLDGTTQLKPEAVIHECPADRGVVHDLFTVRCIDRTERGRGRLATAAVVHVHFRLGEPRLACHYHQVEHHNKWQRILTIPTKVGHKTVTLARDNIVYAPPGDELDMSRCATVAAGRGVSENPRAGNMNPQAEVAGRLVVGFEE